MSTRIGTHIRSNAVAYVALFFAISGGVAVAAKPTDPVRIGDPAGGDLTGTYPNPTIAGGAVSTGKLGFDPATQAELDSVSNGLSSTGTLNSSGNPVDWTKLKNVPAGFADGTDDTAAPTGPGGVRYYGLEFHPRKSSVTYDTPGGSLGIFQTGGPSGVYFDVPVHLPDGAQVTSVDFLILDNSPFYHVEVRMERTAGEGTALIDIDSTTDAFASTGSTTLSLTGSPLTTIDNDNYAYSIGVSFQAPISDLRLYDARVQYTL